MPIDLDYTFQGANHPHSWWVMQCLNLNLPDKYATVVMAGFHDKETYDADHSDVLDLQLLTCNEPTAFDFYFGSVNRIEDSAFVTIIETWLVVSNPDLHEPSGGFFSLGIVWSPIGFESAEVGDISSSVVAVTFTDDVQCAIDFIDGVTIKVNGVAATISSATQPADLSIVQYTLSAPVSTADVVTFEYDGTGTINDANSIGVPAIFAQAVTNQTGQRLWFNDSNNSIWIASR
jgi:hypothetical protein